MPSAVARTPVSRSERPRRRRARADRVTDRRALPVRRALEGPGDRPIGVDHEEEEDEDREQEDREPGSPATRRSPRSRPTARPSRSSRRRSRRWRRAAGIAPVWTACSSRSNPACSACSAEAIAGTNAMTMTAIAAIARPLAVRVTSPAVATGDRPCERNRSASGSVAAVTTAARTTEDTTMLRFAAVTSTSTPKATMTSTRQPSPSPGRASRGPGGAGRARYPVRSVGSPPRMAGSRPGPTQDAACEDRAPWPTHRERRAAPAERLR